MSLPATAQAPGAAERGPLRFATVLDLTDESGVQGARLLAELGARVIRIEPSTGDALRRRGPFLDGEPGLERSLAHLLYNAGKESVALALDIAEAWDLVDRLAGAADLILAPMAKSGPARRFFDTRRLQTVHPHLGVVDAVFRRGGQIDDMGAAADLIGVAAGGLLYVNGFPEDPPNLPYGRLAYRQVSFTLAGTATALLVAKRRRGGGGHVSVSMQEAVAFTMTQATNQNLWRWQGAVGVRAGLVGLGYPTADGTSDALVRTPRSTYQAADGKWVSFATWPATWDAYARLVAEVTGDVRLLQPEWSDPLYRVHHRDVTDDTTAALCAALPRDELVETGQRHGQLILPVNDVRDVAEDPHLAERGFFAGVYHPRLGRALPMPGSVFLSSAGERPRLGPAPGLGEHTCRVLCTLAGLSSRDLADLQANGVCVDGSRTAAREASHA